MHNGHGKQLKATRLASYQIKEIAEDLAQYIRASAPSADMTTELYGLIDEVNGLVNLLEFFVKGMEYELWLKQKEVTSNG
jgi:hypothetical protein